VLSVFAGLRPLAATKNKNSTKELSRGHKLMVSDSGLITLTGGKWTTYRRMAEDAIDRVIKIGKLPASPCITKDLPIHGSTNDPLHEELSVYGSDAKQIEALVMHEQALGSKLCPGFPNMEAEVVWGVRNEMARTVEDVLARRMRILFLNAAKAIEAAPRVASIMQKELGTDDKWRENQLNDFNLLAKQYMIEFYKD
jgi:glycerol-3-phosphate dehydrogenase